MRPSLTFFLIAIPPADRIIASMSIRHVFLGISLFAAFAAQAASTVSPIASSDLVFTEENGVLAIEAEHYFRQTKSDIRAWHLTTATQGTQFADDADGPHVQGASGGAYLEILPDTRHHHGHKLIRGENFSPEPGRIGVLHYKAYFTTPGRYHVWVRAHSTGSEDNGIHVGLNGKWPTSGQRMQWCQGKRTWHWESAQRTEKNHCGEPGRIWLDIPSPGEHVIQFSMREDGFEFDKFILTKDPRFPRPAGAGPISMVKIGNAPKAFAIPANYRDPATPSEAATQQLTAPIVITKTGASYATKGPALRISPPPQPHGSGKAAITGERKQWHKVTLTLDGPYAHELDNKPNPFTDYNMTVTFKHESGFPYYDVPGYFAADGDAGNSSAKSGTKWRAHLSPDKPGKWHYRVSFVMGPQAALGGGDFEVVNPFHGKEGSFKVGKTDKQGRDLRGKGRLQYVGNRYLQFAGDKSWFLKVGADAPETFLGYADFDDTIAGKPQKVPLKTWAPHLKDWKKGDPTWKDGKGKGMIGAINYLSGKGCNVFSFLTYNAGGDGDNVWPFVSRDDKLHYDCSKLDQWGIVFDHGTAKGMYLHFKMQETEMDDNRRGHRDKKAGHVPTSLDGGKLGVSRKLYCRELVARFGHNLALNWNLGEENTQSTEEQIAMIDWLGSVDPYGHHVVVHTFPNEQDKVYNALIGDKSTLTGTSLQNSALKDTHWQTVKWVEASAKAGKPWVVAFDESGSAAHAQCPDLGYQGFDGHDKEGKMAHTQHEVRKQTLWGNLMGGGAGLEYYFGYKFVQNDLVCEDWRSRDQSWDYCRIAIGFFHDNKVPFWEMAPADALVGNPDSRSNDKYCLAKKGEVYVVYLANGGSTELDLSGAKGDFNVGWFNPSAGGALKSGSVKSVKGGGQVSLGAPPADAKQDWAVLVQ